MHTQIRKMSLSNSCMNHNHDYHQLVIAHHGIADFEVEGLGGRIDPFNGCIVPGGDMHYYEGLGNNSHLVIDIPSDSLPDSLARLFEGGRYFPADKGLRHLLVYMYQESQIWNAYPDAADGISITFLSSLYQRVFFSESSTGYVGGRIDMGMIDEYILRHIDQKISVATLARLNNLCTGHFHDLFRRLNGITPGQYLLESRMKHARELVLGSGLPIIDIAEQVGFSSQSALTHAFRRHYGETPGRLRRGG